MDYFTVNSTTVGVPLADGRYDVKAPLHWFYGLWWLRVQIWQDEQWTATNDDQTALVGSVTATDGYS